ncbi:MAG: hypothetical protein M1814_005215 [Vezdaea aestivalis]|nr:MAG: hypothetical protein M1814_005215 [Vezdaea aestivalis]
MDFRKSWMETSELFTEKHSEDLASECASSIAPDHSHFSSASTLMTIPSTPGSPTVRGKSSQLAFPIMAESPELDCPCSPEGESCLVECIYDDYFRDDDALASETLHPRRDEKFEGLGLHVPEPLSELHTCGLYNIGSLPNYDHAMGEQSDAEFDDVVSEYVYESQYCEASTCKVRRVAPTVIEAVHVKANLTGPQSEQRSDHHCESSEILQQDRPSRAQHCSKRLGVQHCASLAGGIIVRPPTPPRSPKVNQPPMFRATRKKILGARFLKRASKPPPVPVLNFKSYNTPQAQIQSNQAIRNSLPYVLELLEGCVEDLSLVAYDLESELLPLLRILLNGGPEATIDAITSNYMRAFRYLAKLKQDKVTWASQGYKGKGPATTKPIPAQASLNPEVMTLQRTNLLKPLKEVFPEADSSMLSALYCLAVTIKWIDTIAQLPGAVTTEAGGRVHTTGDQKRTGRYYADLRPQAKEIRSRLVRFTKLWITYCGSSSEPTDDVYADMLEAINWGQPSDDRHVSLIVAIVGIGEKSGPTWI